MSISAPLAQVAPAGARPLGRVPCASAPSFLLCVCTVASHSSVFLLATASPRALGSPRTAACGLGLWVNEGHLPCARALVWGGVQTGPHHRLRLWEIRVPPTEVPGLSSRGAFISLPCPPHPLGRHRRACQFGLPDITRRTFSSPGPLPGPQRIAAAPGLCSELLSVLAALRPCHDIGLGWRSASCVSPCALSIRNWENTLSFTSLL